MSAPDLTTEVVGYRQWYVTPDLELRPAGHSTGAVWKRGANTATCGRVKEEALPEADPYGLSLGYTYKADPCGDCPSDGCHCGFYALHDPSDHWYGKAAKNSLWSLAFAPQTDPLLSGIVVAWGTLQVHYSGFRAQHARIAALAVPETLRDQAVARAVARAYGVPCVPSEELPRIAAEYGGTVPVELRPDKPPEKVSGYATAMGGLLVPNLYSKYSWGLSPATWQSPPVLPQPSPKFSPAARPRMEFIEGLKKAANRQGPDRPQRAPKKLGGAR